MDSSGCGSKTIVPSAVRFLGAAGPREEDLDGGYGEGSDVADVRAGVFLRPRGSFRFEASSRMVPIQVSHDQTKNKR